MSTMTLEQVEHSLRIFSRNGTVGITVEKVRKWADAIEAHLARQSDGVSEDAVDLVLEAAGRSDFYRDDVRATLTAVLHNRPAQELSHELYEWLDARGLIPDTAEDGSFDMADLITALNDHETSLIDSKMAQEKAEPVISPNDLNAGPEGEWYCEEHPQQLQGHDGCNGAGIPSCARLPLMLRQIRFLEQRNRELFNQYGFLADKALSHRDEYDGGWKLVPIIPTAEQKAAGDELRGEPVESIYDAMVWTAPTSVAEYAMAQKNSSVEALHQERWMLMNSFGHGQLADGRTCERIAEIDAMLSAAPEGDHG